MKLNRFNVGDAVQVKATLLRTKTFFLDGRYEARWVREPCAKVGVIVGAGRRQEGQRIPGSYYPKGIYGPIEAIPPEFIPERTFQVWKVRFGLTNKPVDVLDADVRAFKEPFTLPIQEKAETWREEDREQMRKLRANWPRDQKGRFLKKWDVPERTQSSLSR